MGYATAPITRQRDDVVSYQSCREPLAGITRSTEPGQRKRFAAVLVASCVSVRLAAPMLQISSTRPPEPEAPPAVGTMPEIADVPPASGVSRSVFAVPIPVGA